MTMSPEIAHWAKPSCASFRALQIAACILAAASLTAIGCATAAPYNPQRLGAEQLSRIESICTNTMGLNDWEAPSTSWGAARNADLDPGENHYEGCVASLSEAQQTVDRSQDAPARSVDLRLTDHPVGWMWSGRVGSFYTASPSAIARRERVACAQLGLNPGYPAFANCVSLMNDTFFSIDNPRD